MTTTRHSFTLMLMAFVKDRPGQWIPATEFEQFGRQAWRTRLSEARQKFEQAGDGTIENRTRRPGRTEVGHPCGPILSEYRYRPASSAEPSAPQTQGHDTSFTLRS